MYGQGARPVSRETDPSVFTPGVGTRVPLGPGGGREREGEDVQLKELVSHPRPIPRTPWVPLTLFGPSVIEGPGVSLPPVTTEENLDKYPPLGPSGSGEKTDQKRVGKVRT